MNKRIRKKQAKRRWEEKQRLTKEFYADLKWLVNSPYWGIVHDGTEWKVTLK